MGQFTLRGNTINVVSEDLGLPLTGAPFALTIKIGDNQYRITVNSNSQITHHRRCLAIMHELLHTLNWEAGKNVARHRTCHYLAAAIVSNWRFPDLKIKLDDTVRTDLLHVMKAILRDVVQQSNISNQAVSKAVDPSGAFPLSAQTKPLQLSQSSSPAVSNSNVISAPAEITQSFTTGIDPDSLNMTFRLISKNPVKIFVSELDNPAIIIQAMRQLNRYADLDPTSKLIVMKQLQAALSQNIK